MMGTEESNELHYRPGRAVRPRRSERERYLQARAVIERLERPHVMIRRPSDEELMNPGIVPCTMRVDVDARQMHEMVRVGTVHPATRLYIRVYHPPSWRAAFWRRIFGETHEVV